MTSHRLLALVVLVLAAPASADVAPASPGPAPAPAAGGPTTAVGRERLLAGDTAFAASDYARASTEYAAGFAAEGWSGFLFAWAQSQRLRGDCPSALELYNRFLATSPPTKVEVMTRDAIAACGDTTAPTKVPTNAHPDDTSLEKIELRPPPPVEPPFQHKLAVVLVGSGLVASGVGLGYYVKARGSASDASRQAAHQEAIAHYERAKDRTLVARITGGVGAALVIAGVVRFVLNRPEEREPSTTIVLVPNGIEIAGRF